LFYNEFFYKKKLARVVHCYTHLTDDVRRGKSLTRSVSVTFITE